MVLQPYGVTIAVAVLVGGWVASVEARRKKLDPQLVWEALPWVLVFGIVGARAYHVCHLWEFYKTNLVQVLFVWNGGLGIYGALVGGILGLWIYGRVGGFGGFGRALDVIAPGVAVGQAIGRFANFFSQELYGFPTDLPWGIYISPENRFPGLENFEYFHPLFLYECLWCLLSFVVLIKMSRAKLLTKLLTGERFLLYLSFYAVGRFFLEAMRIESWMISGVRVAQAVSVVVVCGSVILGVFRRTWQKKQKAHI